MNKTLADLQQLPLTRALEWSFLSVETWVFVVVNQLFPRFSHVLSQRRFPPCWMKGEDLPEFRMTTASLILFISLRWRITLLKQRGLCELNKIADILSIVNVKVFRLFTYQRGEERRVKFPFSLFFSLFFSLVPNFFGRFSLPPDFSPFSLISLLRGLFYLLLHRSASFPRVLKEGKHTKHVCHVVISRSSHTTFRFCHVSLKLWCLQHLF